jgi:CRP-like cAMP-binding protein
MAEPLIQHLEALLGPMPDAARKVCMQAPCLSLAAGEALLRAGDRWQNLWWVEQGCFRLYYLDREGRAANKNFYLDGAVLWPITPALATQPADFWVEALSASRIWSVPWSAWQHAVEAWPAWTQRERLTLIALFDDKMHREQQFLQTTATERYQALVAERPAWVQRVPLRHLASYLGITDVALSRIRRRLNPG